MMLSMLQVVGEHVAIRAREALSDDEAVRLQQAFARIGATVGSIISEAYTKGYVSALEDLAGLDPKLTARMLAMEVTRIEAAGRAQLAT
jgi:hypothetical protein